jgi:hypothetical protein
VRSILVTPPAEEPLTVAEAARHLRIDRALTAEEEADLLDMVRAARERIEAETDRALITQTWDLILDVWPYGGGYYNRAVRQRGEGPGWLPSVGGQPIEVPRPPLQAVSWVGYVDVGGSAQVLDPSQYQVSTGTPGRIVPAYNVTWPTTRNQPDAVSVRYVAGYGAAAAVPAAARQAVKLLIGHYYENREAVVTGMTASELPEAVRSLLATLKWGGYSC